MQLIQPSHIARPARGPLLWGTVVGGVLFAGGVVLAWLAFATPIVRVLTPSVVRPTIEQMAFGGLVWGVSLVAPPCFAIVGFIRLWQVGGVILRKPVVGPVARASKLLTDDYLVAPSLEMPDGRRLRNTVVGPFGLAVIGEAPPRAVTRRHGSAWRCAAPTAGGSPSKTRSTGPRATPSGSGAGSAPRSATSSSRSTRPSSPTIRPSPERRSAR